VYECPGDAVDGCVHILGNARRYSRHCRAHCLHRPGGKLINVSDPDLIEAADRGSVSRSRQAKIVPLLEKSEN
jgi:hypothetical protein